MPDEWLHESVRVDIRSVLDFSRRLDTKILDFSNSIQDGVRPMISGPQPRFGGGVVKEGAFFRAMHDRQRNAAAYLINDVVLGLQALAKAAATVAAQYAYGDAQSQATVEDVYRAFRPMPAPAGQGQATEETEALIDEDQPLPPEAYADPSASTTTTNEGEERVIAPNTAGELVVGADDERMYEDVPDVPRRRD